MKYKFLFISYILKPSPNIHNQYIDDPKTDVVSPSKIKDIEIGNKENLYITGLVFLFGNCNSIVKIINRTKIKSDNKPN